MGASALAGAKDAALTSTFETFKAYPQLVAGHVARFL
jgi:hypothetical protein